MIFQLYILISNNKLLDEPYCAVNEDGSRLLMVSEDMIRFDIPVNPMEMKELYRDYLPTSRYITYDFPKLEKLIQAYTGTPNVNFAAHFKGDIDHIGLTFPKPPFIKNWMEYIDASSESLDARKIVDEVYSNMATLLQTVFEPA